MMACLEEPMSAPTFKFRAKVWVYPGPAAWHFVSLPKALSARLKRLFGGLRRGFGSLKVTVTLGGTQWTTSIFPDAKRGSYLLPLKAAVRAQEKALAGKTCAFVIRIHT
jgi:hypothetical protein